MEKNELELVNLIINDTMQDYDFFGDIEFFKSMEKIYSRLAYEKNKFEEDKDFGTENIYFSPHKHNIIKLNELHKKILIEKTKYD